MSRIPEFNIEGYGTFGSVNALRDAINHRLRTGISPLGEAEILMGAKIIQEGDLTRVEDPTRVYPRMLAQVGHKGRFRILYEQDNFTGDAPCEWTEIENP